MSTPDPLPPPPWGAAATARPRRGRSKPPLTREAIVDAALALLDAEGLKAVTMRHVAEALDTGAASFYQHISGKEELLELVFDRVCAEVELPPPPGPGGDWQEPLKALLRSMRSAFSSHRDVAHVTLGRFFTGPHALAIPEAMLAIMDAGGVPPHVSTYALDALYLFVVITAYDESVRVGRRDGPESSAQSWAELRAYLASLPTDRFPTLARLAEPLARPDTDDDERFELALEVQVRGIASLAAAGG